MLESPAKDSLLFQVPKPEEPTEVEGPKPDAIYEWRRLRMQEMGFVDPWCGVIAGLKDVDLHKIGRMLKNGCSHDLVLRIVL